MRYNKPNKVEAIAGLLIRAPLFAVLGALSGGLAVGAELTSAAAAAAGAAKNESSAPSRQDRPELAEIHRAIQAFRVITTDQGLRPAQRIAGPAARSNGGRATSWHGRVFEYLRNDVLDAVPHEVVQRGGERNLRRRNQFGFTVNGPVLIPGVYDGRGASFFTFSYEGTRERVGRSYLLTLPTAQQRFGDFSDLVNRAGRRLTVYDPASTRHNPLYDPSLRVSRSNLEYERDPFPDNRIPQTRLDRVARAATASYPQPNTDVGPFLRNNYWSNPSERNSPDGFIARLDHSLGERQQVTLTLNSSDGYQETPDIYPGVGNPSRPDRMFRKREIEVADAVTLTPNLTYRGAFKADSEVTDTLSLVEDRDLPAEIDLRGVSGRVFPAFRFRGYTGLGASQRSYLRNAFADYELENELIFRKGDHTWTLSSDVRALDWGSLELDSPSGSFSFNDRITGLPGVNNTGDSFATFLLGQAWRAETTDQPHPAYIRRRSFQNSLGNQWHATPSLTLSLRLTIDASSPRTEKFDRQSTFDPEAINPASGTPGALVFAGRHGEGRAFQPYRIRTEPRIGLSWSPTADRRTVVRGSYLRYYSPVTLRSGPFGTQGFSGRRYPVSANRQLAPAVTLERGFPLASRLLPDLRGDYANDTDVDMIPRTSAQPTFNYATLEIERKLPKGLTVRARGRTTRGRDMLIGGQIVGLNQAPAGALVYRDRLNDESFRRSLRRFPHVQKVRMNYQYPGGKYRYDEGRVNLQKRTGDGLSLDLEYAYRKRWDDYSGPGIQDPSDRSTAWARSNGLRPRRFSLAYTYELPFGRGKPMLARPGVLAKMLADWSVSGFTNWYGGDPITLEPLFNNTGGIVPYLRVDAVPGVDPAVRDPGPEAWFNPRAFVDPEDFTLGNVPRTHPTLRNPQYRLHDISLAKRLVLSKEQSVELLVQSFNFLNQGNWNDPDDEIGPANARNVNAGKIIGSRGGRVLQIGLRYHF